MNSVISLLFFIFSHITTKLLGIASRIPHVCDYTCSEKNHESERMRVIFMLTAVGKVSEFNGATKKGRQRKHFLHLYYFLFNLLSSFLNDSMIYRKSTCDEEGIVKYRNCL